MSHDTPLADQLDPTIIETPSGPVPVFGTNQHAAQVQYIDREHATEAMRKALAGIDAVARRYGLYVVAAVSADCEEKTLVAGHVHGDGQFVGVAMNQLVRMPGWADAMSFETDQLAAPSAADDRPN